VIDLLLAASPMVEKLGYLLPEMTLFVATVAVLVLGSSKASGIRSLCGPVAAGGLVIAGVLAYLGPTLDASPVPGLLTYGKTLVAAVGVYFLAGNLGGIWGDA